MLLTSSTAVAQKSPQFYGVYALQNGQLTKLEGRSVSELGGFAGASGIIRHPPVQKFSDGSLKLIIFRRDLSAGAPDSFFVSIVAKVAVEKTIAMNGQVTASKPVSGMWALRDRGYKFSVGPYGDNKEMVQVVHENDGFKLPDGRYAVTIGTEYYDFLVNKESANLEHCVEWHAQMTGVALPQCSAITTPVVQPTPPPLTASTPSEPSLPRTQMSLDCSARASEKGLHGAERRDFMTACKASSKQ
jgi:hypothetical protein